MAVPSLGQITGENIQELINSLEKQRKELEYILSSLDATNILEISADLINSGTLGTEFVDLANINADIDNLQARMVDVEASSSGSSTDLTTLKTRMTTAETDINAVETRMTTAETDINAVETRMTTAEGDIDALQLRATTAETDINAVETRVTTTETDINAVEVRMTTAETDINAAETRITTVESKLSTIEAVTSDPVTPSVGQMWLRTDL